jgi:hypothetical protein
MKIPPPQVKIIFKTCLTQYVKSYKMYLFYIYHVLHMHIYHTNVFIFTLTLFYTA